MTDINSETKQNGVINLLLNTIINFAKQVRSILMCLILGYFFFFLTTFFTLIFTGKRIMLPLKSFYWAFTVKRRIVLRSKSAYTFTHSKALRFRFTA